MQIFSAFEKSFTSMIKIIPFFIFIIVLVISPIWICVLLLSLAVYFIKLEYKIPCVIFLWIFSSIFLANVDQTGDILNYKAIYENFDSQDYVNEYSSEPLILYFYAFFHFLNATFDEVLLVQAATLNALALFIFVRIFGVRGIKYYPMLILFPQYIQQLLFLSRQSLAIMMFLTVFISYRHGTILSFLRKSVSILLALAAHSIVLMYSVVYVFSSSTKKYVTWQFLVIVFAIVIIFPLNIDAINNVISGLLHYSGSLDRKIRFYLINSVPGNDPSFSLFSMSLLPLHASFFIIIMYLKKYKHIPDENCRVVIFFVVLYFFTLLIRNYSLLPARFSLVIILVVPFFYYYMTLILYPDYKYSAMLNSIFFLYVLASFVKFLITNDYGDYNITLLNKDSLSESIFTILAPCFK